MEHHVYAVWDFMSLLKSLQIQITGSTVPWLPPPNRTAARLINEIVLQEESDETACSNFSSHFELYIRSMNECGASVAAIHDFLNLLRGGVQVQTALVQSSAPPSVQSFIGNTFSTIESKETIRIASAFTFGREDLLPSVFEKIVDQLNSRNDGKLDIFRFYLNRHIELDAGHHGPMAEQMIESLCGDSLTNWQHVEMAASDALQARLCLWDGIHQQIQDARFRQHSLNLEA
jgi:hypothetical protein